MVRWANYMRCARFVKVSTFSDAATGAIYPLGLWGDWGHWETNKKPDLEKVGLWNGVAPYSTVTLLAKLRG
jgi:hypothetical protein